MKLPYLITICTHHKTGTVWMDGVFRKTSKRLDLLFSDARQEELPAGVDVWLEHHSRVDMPALRALAASQGREARLLHLIRDPRDVIISGAHYHTHTKEQWANRPRPQFGGKSYRDAMCALENDADRLVFEMDHAGGTTVRDMVGWGYGTSECYEARYEDLIVDRQLERFTEILGFLGLTGGALGKGLDAVRKKSLFGGLENPRHVRSGKAEQWREIFTPPLRSAFASRFPDALQRLGYDDGSWLRADTPQSLVTQQ